MRRTKADAENTGRDILNAAEKLFLEQGFDGVTLDEIAAAAGVTRGAVHWHYKNKIGLLLELRSRTQEPFRVLAQEFQRSKDQASTSKVIALLGGMFRQMEKDPKQRALIRVTFHCDLASTVDDRSIAFHQEMREILLQIFNALAHAKGLRKPWTPETCASTFSAMVGGLLLDWALERAGFNLSTDGTAMVSLALNALVEG